MRSLLCICGFILLFCIENCNGTASNVQQCMIPVNNSCLITATNSSQSFCCNYLSGSNVLTPKTSASYMKQIRNIGISHVVLRCIFTLAAGVLVTIQLLDEEKEAANCCFTGLICFTMIIVFCLSWSIVGIIDQQNIINLFNDLESNGCYISSPEIVDYPLSWFNSQTTAIFAAAISVGILSILAIVVSFVTGICVEDSSSRDFDPHLGTICCQIILFVSEIVLWAYLFPTCKHWDIVHSAKTCYILDTPYPTHMPTVYPTHMPTLNPSLFPSISPTLSTLYPSVTPTFYPSNHPSSPPTMDPTTYPSVNPSASPIFTVHPTTSPTPSPTLTNHPTKSPTIYPTSAPTITPTFFPTNNPTKSPTFFPTSVPTASTLFPSTTPTFIPTSIPTYSPTVPTSDPTLEPTQFPTVTNGLENFSRVDVSHLPPFWIVGAGTFIAFLVNLYIFTSKNEANQSKQSISSQSHEMNVLSEPFLQTKDEASHDLIVENKNEDDDGHDSENNNNNEDEHDSEQFTHEEKPKIDRALSAPLRTPLLALQDDSANNNEDDSANNDDSENKDDDEHDSENKDNSQNKIDAKKINNEDDSANADKVQPKQSRVSRLKDFCCKCGCWKSLKYLITDKYQTEITWLIVIYQIVSLIYSFFYSWHVASNAAPDSRQFTWNNYQCFAKSFAVSSHFKNEMTTLFAWFSKDFLLQRSGGESKTFKTYFKEIFSRKNMDRGTIQQDYHKSVIAFLFFWVLLGALYVVFFITHLIPGIIILFPFTIFTAITLFVIYGALKYFTKPFGDNDELQKDLIIWIGALTCSVCVVVCGAIMECMVIFWDEPSLWSASMALVFTERSFSLYFASILNDIAKALNFIAMLF